MDRLRSAAAAPWRRRGAVLLVAVAGLLLIAGSAFAAAAGTPSDPPRKTDVRGLRPGTFEPGEVIVRFAADVSQSERRNSRAAAGTKLQRKLRLHDAEHLTITDGRSVGQAIAALQRRPGVLYAQPNYRYTKTATPNDPRFEDLWGLHNTGKNAAGGNVGVADADIDAPEAWDGKTGSSLKVAVVDTGVDSDHPDLAANMWTGWDFVNEDDDPQDPDGHGTHVAGTIGGVGDNGRGVAGVAWDVNLIPVRVLNAVGSGTSVDIMEGFDYAVDQGADIVNASLGGSGFDQATRDVIAAAADTLFVVAAGNETSNNDSVPAYPCNYTLSNIVCVAATDRSDALADFSNWGDTHVDMAAPGVDILSTYPRTERVFSEDFQSGAPGWQVNGRWDLELTQATGDWHLSDSPGGTYVDGEHDQSYAQRSAVDLSGKDGCRLTYRALWALGTNDSVSVQGSLSSTGPWWNLVTHVQQSNGEWENLAADLKGPPSMAGWPEYDFNWNQIHLRFLLNNPSGGDTSDGIYFDDIAIDCQPPTTSTTDSYQSLSGTSMATPHVAGAAALVWEQHPTLTPTQLRSRLMETGDAIPALADITVSGRRLNLYRALGVQQAASLDCRDGNGDSPTSYDVEINPTFGPQAAETYTCEVADLLGEPMGGARVNLENLAGANDGDDDAIGGLSSTSDAACTTGSDGRCTIIVAPTEAAEGDAAPCFWTDTDTDNIFDAAGPESDGGKCDEEGLHDDHASARGTDVTKITWGDPNMYLDCDDRTGDDSQLNNLAATPTETYTCTVTNDSGDGLPGLWIDLENMNGVNDLDDDATGGTGGQADGGCSFQTDADGKCTVEVGAAENTAGIDDICFWVDRDGDHDFDITSTGSAGASDGGYCDAAEEPWDEAEATDREEKGRIKWTDCTAVWDGSVNNTWQGALYVNDSLVDVNWSYLVPHAAVYPTSADRVCIDEGETVVSSTTDTIGALDNDGTLNKTEGTLTIAGLGAGTRPSEAGTLNFSGGTITGDGLLQVDDVLTWSGGTMDGAGITRILGAGTVRLTGDSRLTNGRVLQNLGTLEFVGGAGIGAHSGTGTVHNLVGGDVVKSGGGTASFCSWWCIAFNNDGDVNVLEGILNLTNSGTGNGDWFTADGAAVHVNGSYTLGDGTTIRGAGVRLLGGNVVLDGDIDIAEGGVLRQEGASLWGTHMLHGPGTFRWNSGTIDATESHNVTTLAADLLTEITGDARVVNGRRVDNHGRLEFDGDTGFGVHSGTGTVRNMVDGRVVKTAGINSAHFCTWWCGTFVNNGRAWSESGTLQMNNGTSSGEFSSTSTGGIRFAGGYTLADGTHLEGDNVVLNGTNTVTGTITLPSGAIATLHGDLNGTHTFTGPGRVRWTGGTIDGAGSTTIAGGTTVEIKGDTRIVNSRVLDNHGTIDFVGDHTVGNHSGVGTIHNHSDGLIVKSGGTGTGHFNGWWNVGLENDGVVRSESGTLDLNGGSNGRESTGVYRAADGAALRFGGNDHHFGNDARLAGAGTVALTAGRVVVNAMTPLTDAAEFTGTFDILGGELVLGGTSRLGAGTTTRFTGGTIAGSGQLEIAGTMIWSGGTMDTPGRTDVMPGGELRLTGDSRINNSRILNNAGTMHFVGAAGIGTSSGSATINNLAGGVVRKTADGLGHFCSYWCVPFNNDGLVRAEAGELRLNSSGSGAGDWATVETGQVVFTGSHALGDGTDYSGTGVSFSAGSHRLTGDHTIGTDSVAHVTGGTLYGTHTINGPGTLRWATGSLDADVTDNVTTLAPDAHLQVAQDLRIINGRTIENHGRVEFTGDTGIGVHSGNGTLRNATDGRVYKSAGSNTASFCTYWCARFDNDGRAWSEAGTLQINHGTSSGSFETTGDGRIGFVSEHTLNDGTDIVGDGIALGGTTTINGTLNVAEGAVAILSGTITGEHTFAGPGRLEWTTGILDGPHSSTIAPGTTVEVWGPGRVVNGRVLNNHGTLDFVGDHALGNHSGSATLHNHADGVILKSGGSGDAHFVGYWGLPLRNDGAIEVRSGRLLVNGGFDAYDAGTKTLTKGRYIARDGATLVLSGVDVHHNAARVVLTGAGSTLKSGDAANALAQLASNAEGALLRIADGAELATGAAELSNAGAVEVASDSTLTAVSYRQTGGSTTLQDDTPENDTTARLVAPTVTLEGGIVGGNGEIVGDVTNTGATVQPGSSPGTLSVTGAFTQSAGGALELEVDGANAGEYDVLAVAGTATIGGSVTLLPGTALDPVWGLALPVISSPTAPVLDGATFDSPAIAEGVTFALEVVDGAVTLVTKDAQAPVNATLASPSHTDAWSRDGTVDVTLSGATDNFSGVAGHAVVWDTAADTVPAAAKTTGAVAATRSANLPTGEHWLHVRTVDGAGNWSDTVHLGPFRIDRTAPTKAALTTPTTKRPYSLLVSADGKPSVRAVWRATTDTGSGLAGYRVSYRSRPQGGGFTTAKWSAVSTARQLTIPGTPGTTYCFRVQSIDNVGNAALGAEQCAGVPLEDSTLAPSKTAKKSDWTAASASSLYRGKARTTSVKGATLSKDGVQARRLALIVTRCSGCGSVEVLFGGTSLGTFSTAAKTTKNQVVIPVGVLPKLQTGKLVIKTLDAKPVTIDGVALRSS